MERTLGYLILAVVVAALITYWPSLVRGFRTARVQAELDALDRDVAVQAQRDRERDATRARLSALHVVSRRQRGLDDFNDAA